MQSMKCWILSWSCENFTDCTKARFYPECQNTALNLCGAGWSLINLYKFWIQSSYRYHLWWILCAFICTRGTTLGKKKSLWYYYILVPILNECLFSVGVYSMFNSTFTGCISGDRISGCWSWVCSDLREDFFWLLHVEDLKLGIWSL